jgi:hypothetical protein
MHQYQRMPMRMSEKLEAQFTDICCVFSPLHVAQLDVFVHVSQVASFYGWVHHGRKKDFFRDYCGIDGSYFIFHGFDDNAYLLLWKDAL